MTDCQLLFTMAARALSSCDKRMKFKKIRYASLFSIRRYAVFIPIR